jgi:hypothetical protein
MRSTSLSFRPRVKPFFVGYDFLRLAAEAVTEWSTQFKDGPWGEGHTEEAEIIGLCGEHAGKQALGSNRLPDLSPLPPGGKPWDFLGPPPLNYRMEIKTSTYQKAKEGLIRAVNDYGKPRPLNCEVYIFATLLDSVRDALRYNEKVRVIINGWVGRAEVPLRTYPPRAENGKHRNYEVPFDLLHPIPKLLEVCGIEDRWHSTIKTFYSGD